MISYGATNKRQIFEMAEAVVDCLGGGDNALRLIIETVQQETKLGGYPDKNPYGAGVGLGQNDLVPFFDTRERTSTKHKALIKKEFGVVVGAVNHRDLAYSPLLALIWCRMHYLLRPGAIPADLGGRAAYWKRWYNSSKGKGTENEYIANAKDIKWIYL